MQDRCVLEIQVVHSNSVEAGLVGRLLPLMSCQHLGLTSKCRQTILPREPPSVFVKLDFTNRFFSSIYQKLRIEEESLQNACYLPTDECMLS